MLKSRVFSFFGRFAMVLLFFGGLMVRDQSSPALAYNGSYALYFDGVNDEVLSAAGDVVFGANCRTEKAASVWFKPTGVAPTFVDPTQGDLIVGGNPSWWGIYRVNISGVGDRIIFWNWDTNPDIIMTPYTVGEWVHLAFVHTGGMMYAYKNGQLVGSMASGSTGGLTCQTLKVAGLNGGPTQIQRVEGYIDEVVYWSTPPSAATIRNLIHREVAPSDPNYANLGVYYKFSDGAGLTVTDDGPNNYTGVITGSPDWVASGAFAGPRNALDFDGTDDFVNIVDAAPLDLTGSMTFEAWVNPAAWNNGANTPFLVKGDGTVPEINYYFGKSDSNQLVFRYGSGSLTSVADTSGSTYVNGAWYHIAIVADVANSQLQFYRDGRLLSSVPHVFGSLTANAHSLTVADLINSSDANFSGQLDEVRLWNTARSQAEIRSSMANTLTGYEPGLVAYYRFDQPAAASEITLEDVSSNNLDGTLVSMAPLSDWVASTAFNSWTGAVGTDWNTAGNWSRESAPVAADNVGIAADYPAVNMPSLNAPVSVDTLVVGSGASLIVGSSGAFSASGFVHNLGLLQQTQAVSGSSDFPFLASGSYGGIIVNPAGIDLGSVTVAINGAQDCTTVPGETVRRCFEITSSNPPTDAAVTFFFEDTELSTNQCTDLEVFHFVGVAWQVEARDPAYGTAGRLCGANPQSIKATGIDSFSSFVLKSLSAPTAIRLEQLSARSGLPGAVMWLLAGVLLAGVSLFFRKFVARS